MTHADFLRQRFGDIADVEELSGGDWSRAFGFRHEDQDLVIRFGQHREDYKTDRRAFALSSEALPVPEVLEIGEALGGYYCLSRRAFGDMLDQLDADRMRQAVPSVLQTLDALRLSNPSILDFNTALPWAERLLAVDDETDRVYGWHDKMETSTFGDGVYQKGLTFLRSALAD